MNETHTLIGGDFVLGGGIAGLVWAFYNSSFKIVSKDIGGQFNNYFNLGPRFLEDTLESRQFLRDMGLPIKEKSISVGYKKLKLITKNKYSRKLAVKYYQKSRGVNNQPSQTFMNNQKTKMSVLDTDFDIIISKLKTHLSKRFIVSNIKKIDYEKKIFMTSSDNYKYNNIVSTIPLNILLYLTGANTTQYKAQSVTYVLLPKSFINIKDFDFVYCCGEEPYHRLTQTSAGIVADVLGEKTQEEIKYLFPALLDYKVVKNIQIITGKPLTEFKNIKLFGRYGTWNREYKTEKVIKEAQENALFHESKK